MRTAAQDPHLAGGRRKEARQHVEESGLTRAVGAEQTGYSPRQG